MDLVGILTVLGLALGFVLVGGLIAAFTSFMRTRLQKEDMELLDRIAEIAVWGVEQVGAGVFGSKKEAATGIIRDQLNAQGKLDRFAPSMLDAAIEANVGQNFHYEDHTSKGGES